MTKRRSSSPSARGIAVRVLRDVQQRRRFSNRALSDHLERHPDLDPRDRGLVTHLVYGVLRHRERLDVHIDRHARQPRRLRGEVRDVVRVAAFEMLELDRPAPVAITEALALVRRLDAGGLSKAVQAILGAVARTAKELDEELESKRPLDVINKRWSIPRWLAGRWLAELGEQTALARARALAEPPPIDVRIDLGRTSVTDVIEQLRRDHPSAEIATVPDQPQALRIRGAGDLFFGPLHEQGLLSVQGLAAQQPAIELAPQPGETVLDACAGLGVKTLQLAELMQRRGRIVAVDIDEALPRELEEIQRRGRLAGSDLDVQAVVGDLSEPLPALEGTNFDRVLLDVPCTGLGNLARHPEIRWFRTYEDIADRARLQQTLLAQALRHVRPGCDLVYAVCSPEPDEGRSVVRTLSQAELVAERTLTPEVDHTEGFYWCRLRRK